MMVWSSDHATEMSEGRDGEHSSCTLLFLRADNVFDRNYELAADFSTGGARIFGGVRWRL